MTSQEGEYWSQLVPGTALSEFLDLSSKEKEFIGERSDASMSLFTDFSFRTFPTRSLKSLTITEFFMVDQLSSGIEDCVELSELFSLSFAFGCSSSDAAYRLIMISFSSLSVPHDDFRSRLAVLRNQYGDLGTASRSSKGSERSVWDDQL